MKWSNLKNYKCPDCSADMKQESPMLHVCSKCRFKISNEKLKQIISNKPIRYVEPDRSKWEW